MESERKKIERFENWPSMLTSFLQSEADKELIIGTHDCVLFAADLVWFLTGWDPAWAFRDTYSTKEEAEAIAAGAGGLEALWSTHARMTPHRNGNLAKRGDIILMTYNGVEIFGAIDDTGTKVACLHEVKGLIRLPIKDIVAVWTY